MKYRFAISLLAAFGAASVAWATAQPPPASAPAGKIAYTRLEGQALVIHLADTGFSNDRPAPGMVAAMQIHPALSPDGQRLAFAAPSALDPSDWDIFSIGADGSKLKRLIANATLPAWSPDGGQLLYTLSVDPPAIGIAKADGTASRPLAPKLPVAVAPFWAPDGKRIGFSGATRRDARMADVYSMDLATGDLQRITDGRRLYIAGAGAWSPDGTQIVVFAADPLTKKGEIQVWDLLRKSSRRLADFGVPVDPSAVQLTAANALRFACWSPDGHWVLATLGTNRGDHATLGLYQIAADTGVKTRLTPDAANCLMGSWGK